MRLMFKTNSHKNVCLDIVKNKDIYEIIGPDKNVIAQILISEVEKDNGQKSEDQFYLEVAVDLKNRVAHNWCATMFNYKV